MGQIGTSLTNLKNAARDFAKNNALKITFK